MKWSRGQVLPINSGVGPFLDRILVSDLWFFLTFFLRLVTDQIRLNFRCLFLWMSWLIILPEGICGHKVYIFYPWLFWVYPRAFSSFLFWVCRNSCRPLLLQIKVLPFVASSAHFGPWKNSWIFRYNFYNLLRRRTSNRTSTWCLRILSHTTGNQRTACGQDTAHGQKISGRPRWTSVDDPWPWRILSVGGAAPYDLQAYHLWASILYPLLCQRYYRILKGNRHRQLQD